MIHMAKELPAHLARIAIQRAASTDFALPPIPQLPQSITNRFPELKVWNGQMDEWRRVTEGLIREATTTPVREDPAG